jgi:hypothetical protein
MEGLIDTRDEYIEHIQDILSVAISKRIYAIYTEIMEEKKGLKGFQNELYSIRKWNNNIVSDEYKKIVKYTKCKYLANLIKIIIITTIKIKIYEYREQFDNIKIKIPNAEDFVHKCYINAASFSWKNAYLYNRNNIKDAEYQNNLNIIEENIRAIVKKTFRDFIPFDEIFKQIEDNLSDNVHQYKDTDAKSVDVEITKKKKKHPTDIKADEESEAEEDEAEDEEDDEESEAEEDEAEDDEAEEDEEDEAEDDEESEAGEDEAEEEEAEEDEAEEAEDDEAEEAEDDEAEDKNEVEAEATKETKKTDNDTEVSKDTNNKIHNIVDIKYSDDKTYETVEPRKTFASQEISFEAPEAVEADETSLPSSIHKEWDTIKDEYSSLSQNKMAYKTFDKKKYDKSDKSDKSDNYDDDAISIASHTSGISNITDISHIKQIHITDTNKSKKPTFF